MLSLFYSFRCLNGFVRRKHSFRRMVECQRNQRIPSAFAVLVLQLPTSKGFLMPKTACISGETGIPYILIRSKRKTISIRHFRRRRSRGPRAYTRFKTRQSKGSWKKKGIGLPFIEKNSRIGIQKNSNLWKSIPSCLPFLGRQYPVLAGIPPFRKMLFIFPESL